MFLLHKKEKASQSDIIVTRRVAFNYFQYRGTCTGKLIIIKTECKTWIQMLVKMSFGHPILIYKHYLPVSKLTKGQSQLKTISADNVVQCDQRFTERFPCSLYCVTIDQEFGFIQLKIHLYTLVLTYQMI